MDKEEIKRVLRAIKDQANYISHDKGNTEKSLESAVKIVAEAIYLINRLGGVDVE